MAMRDNVLLACSLFCVFAFVNGEQCFTDLYYRYYINCATGCCGSYYDRYCCGLSAGPITGIVFGCALGLGLLIGGILVCVRYKKRQIRNGSNPTVAVVSSGSHQTTYPGQVYPPSYPYPAQTYPPNVNNGNLGYSNQVFEYSTTTKSNSLPPAYS